MEATVKDHVLQSQGAHLLKPASDIFPVMSYWRCNTFEKIWEGL
jgi:hypothetical protein